MAEGKRIEPSATALKSIKQVFLNYSRAFSLLPRPGMDV